MMSETETGVPPGEHLFQMTCVVSAKDVRLSACSEIGNRQLLALVMGSGDITIHYLSGDMNQHPVMRWIPWFVDSNRRITAVCFDPSGSWLLVAGNDGSIFIIPALSLVDPKAVLDQTWSTTDLTYIPSPLLHANPSNSGDTSILRSHPTSIVWWQSLLECQHVAIMGTDCGDIIFVSLTTGLQVGITFVRATISLLHICQDNSLDSVFLLITSDNRSQWKLLLEQRATGYGWPIDSSGSAVKVVTSNNKLAASSHTSVGLESGNRSVSYLPSTRSRLQGLKQLSVEKLTSLRQRLAETRSKGTSAMAVNIHFRRESSGSSSDDTVCSSSMAIKPAAAESSDLPAVHHVTTGPQPERLSSEVGDTFMCPQFARGRRLLSGYYAPTSIVSIHGMSLDVVPLFVHKLAQQCRDILVTDRFLYVTDIDGKSLSVVSCQLSESRIVGDSDYNPESVIERFEMKDSNERILSVYKRSCSNDHHRKPSAGVSSKPSLVAANKDFNPQLSFDKKSQGGCREKEKKSSSQAPFCLPKSVKELKLDMPSIDGCVIVTTNGVYEVNLRLSPAEVFMDLVLTYQAIDKAEKLAVVFGLNLQQLLEVAGDLKLSAKEFPQAIALYRLSKCRHLKSVLKFASAGHAVELLGYITLLFSTAGIDLTTSERIHLSNLAVMSHTEQVLRATTGRVKLLKQFLKFLRENLYYDEVLAVNVAGQTGLWEVLQFLASNRGLHPEVLDILTKIVKSLGEGLVKANSVPTTNHLPALDCGLWLCVSDPSLLQSLLSKPQQARIHLQFVRSCLPHLEQFALQRLAALFDPSSPQLRPSIKRMFKTGRRREHSSGSYSSYSTQTDSLDLLDSVDEIFVPSEDVVQTFLLILLYLAKKRQVSSSVYIPELMEKIQLAKDDDDENENSEVLYPSLPVHVTTLSAGFSHVALIRNGAIYTWGNALQGCLGTGPTMSRYSCPQQISILPGLKVEIISVSCGRQHTLSLTNNGVYAWGSSQYGQLGIGKTGQSPYPRLVEHLSRERIIAVSAGQYHSIALADDGRVFTWGWGVHGQLGHHSVEDCHVPTLVERLIGKVVTQICGGHGHTVCLTAEGHVYTFGSSVFGQLGNGSNVKSSVPVHVTALIERITIIATNYFHNLAVSSSNKLYMWGSSPQVLRLQAQAQKKARLLQQQHFPSGVTPLSPSKPVTPQVQSTLDIKSDVSGPLLLSPTSTSAATPVHIMQQESSPTGLTESLKEELPNLNLKLVLNSYDSELPSLVQARVNLKNNVPSHSELPSSLLSNSTDSVDSASSTPKSVLNSEKYHKFSEENNSIASEVDNKGYVNNQKRSSQSSDDFPVPKRERICKEQVTEMSHSEKGMQKSQSYFFGSEEKQETFQSSCETYKSQSGFSGSKEKQEAFQSLCGSDKVQSDIFGSEEKREAFQSSCESDTSAWNKKSLQLSHGLSQDSFESSAQPISSSVFSDFESASMDTSSRNMHPPGSLFASRRMDQNLNLKVKPSYPPLTATTAEGYSIAALIVSPTMEFKGLTAGPPPLDNNFASPDVESSNQSSRSEPVDDGQPHLTPQLVDTSLVVGRIVQVSCGCHHSALLTNEGVLCVWGRNLDGQLGNGTRKEIPIPTPLTSAAVSATASTKTSSLSKSPSVSGVLSGGENLRLKQVSCGCDFTVAQESAPAGKIWGWGSNSQAQLGRVPVEESKGLEGKLVMFKTTKRVVKLPHGNQNSSDVPRAVPSLPNSTISFKYDNLSGIGACSSYLIKICTDVCPPLCSIEELCYGLRTLHYALQHFHGYYDSTYLLNKCLALENYQGAAKLAALDRHYHLALAYQLKALALASLEFGSNPEEHFKNQCTDFSKIAPEKMYGSNRTFLKISNSTMNVNEFSDYSNEDKMRTTCFTHNPDVANTVKNKNSKPVLVNYKEEFKVHVSDVNSSCVPVEQFGANSNVENGSANNKTKENENTVTDSNLVGKTIVSTEAVVNVSRKNEDTGHCDEYSDDTTVNKMRRNSLISSTADSGENILNIEGSSDVTKGPQNSNCKSKIITESKTETQSISKVEETNQRNCKIDLLYNSENKSEANEVKHSKEPEGMPKVEFSSKISLHINENLQPNLKHPSAQSNTDEVKLELNKEENLKFEDSKQETNSIKPPDHISSKTQVNMVEEAETSSSVSTPESLTLLSGHDSEMHAFAVQGGTEQMSEGQNLTSPDCSTSLLSEEQGLLSPEPILPQTNEGVVSEGQGVVCPEPIVLQVNEQVVNGEQGLVSPEPILCQVSEWAVSEEQHVVSSGPIVPKVKEWVLSEEQHLVSPEPVLPQANEQNSQSAGMNFVSANGDGNFQNPFVVSPEGDKNNSDKHQTEMISNLTPVLNSDTGSTSESYLVIKQKNLCEYSGFNSCCFNDGAGLQRNSDADIPAIKNDIISVADQSGEEGSVNNEDREMKYEANNVSHEFKNSKQLYDQENTSATKSLTSDTLNGTVDAVNDLNKAVASYEGNKICVDSDGGSEVMGSDCNKFQCRVDLALKSPQSEELDMQLNNCGTEEKMSPSSNNISVSLNTGLQASSLLLSTESDVVETTNAITAIGGEETIKASALSVQGHQNDTGQSFSDRRDLDNCGNELKISSDDKDFYLTQDAVGNEVYVKSTDTVMDEVCDNKFSRNVISAETDFISVNGVNETARSAQQVYKVDESNTSDHLTETRVCKDLVNQAAAVVEYYVSVMEEDSHAMMSRLLQQGFEFWLSHSLPVDHLENLLLKHMSKFFYPLGLLLFCKTGNTGEEEVETQQQAVSMLNHLSTRFCLQLCSNLLNHIDQKKAYPEYIELLAQVTSVQTSPGLNGCCLTAQGPSQSPEQLMEAILEGLGATKGLGGSLGQTCITVQEEVSEACKDLSSETTKLEQLLAFSCGHHYGQSVFHQSVLPELELGLLQLHHPLPNTARVLKGLFCSNSPNLHLACPRCVLSYLQSQTTPPL